MKALWRQVVDSQATGNLLLAITLATIFSLHTGIDDLRHAYDEQTSAFQRGSIKPMSTTYEDRFGHMKTVNTPYQPTGLGAQHKLDLTDVFCEFPPSVAPEWWNPANCP